MRWAPSSTSAGVWLLLACTAPAPREQPELERRTVEAPRGREAGPSTEVSPSTVERDATFGRHGLVAQGRAQPLAALPVHVRIYARAADQARLAYADFDHPIPFQPFDTSIYVINDDDAELPLSFAAGEVSTTLEAYATSSGWVRISPDRVLRCGHDFGTEMIAPRSFVRLEVRREGADLAGRRVRFRVGTSPALTTNSGILASAGG